MAEHHDPPVGNSAEQHLSPEERAIRVAQINVEHEQLSSEWKTLHQMIATTFEQLRATPADAMILVQLENLMNRQSEIIVAEGAIEEEVFLLLSDQR